MAYGCVVQILIFLSAVAWLGRKYDNLPMNHHTSSAAKPLLDEGIAGGNMLNNVLVFHVIDLDDVVLEIHEEIPIQRQPQHGYYMCDVGIFQCVSAS